MRRLRFVICLAMILLGVLALPGAALADDNANPLTINVTYPTLAGIAGSGLTYEVELNYSGNRSQVFDLQVKPPAGWDVYVNPQGNTSTRISSIRLNPAAAGAFVNVVANIPIFPIPNPGDYKITLTASSGATKASADLTAVVTPKFNLTLAAPTDDSGTPVPLEATAQAGKDTVVAINVQNFGTGTVNDIAFSTVRKPEGWSVTFDPAKIDSLTAFNEVTDNVTIRPDAKALPGDYVVSFQAAGTQATAPKIDVRVTVAGSNIWVWVQLALAVIFVAALLLLFLRSNKR